MALAFAVALITLLASTACGQALLRLVDGRAWAWTAPVTGFALLLTTATATVRLPGRGITAAIALGLIVVASLAVLRGRVARQMALPAPTTVAVLFLVSLPFISNGRVGILGVSVDNDLGAHFAWSDALRTGNDALFSTILAGYPIGPHALAAALAELFATNAAVTFTALLLVTPVLAGFTAYGVLPDLAAPLRFLGSLVVAVPYLTIAYFAEGAFKEPLESMLILTFTIELRDLCVGRARSGEAIALGLIAAAAVEVYGFPGIAPLLATTGVALVLLQAFRLRRPNRNSLKRAETTALLALGAATVALLPQVGRTLAFSTVEEAFASSSNPFGGNFVGDISGFQVFGLWPSSDFRLPLTSTFRAGEIAAFGAAVALYGVFWWLRRRDPFLPSAAASCLLIYAYVHHTEVAYISAKALAIGTMTVVALCVFPLLGEAARSDAAIATRLAHGVIALVFVGGALWSSGLELRNAQVGPLTHADELRSIDGVVHGKPTLFLGHDDFAPWELLDAKLTYPFEYLIRSRVPVEYRQEKPISPGAPLDFDSVVPSALDRFAFVVAPWSGFASSPPANWHEVRRGRWFAVWRRSGLTPDRRVLQNEGTGPGAVLDCKTSYGASLQRLNGMAAVRPEPVTLPAPNWTLSSGVHPQPDELGFAAVPAGMGVVQSLSLPQGQWEVSLQYASPTPVLVSINRVSTTIPANLDREGPYWHVTDVVSDGGRVRVVVTPKPASGLASRLASIGTLALTRRNARETIIPLRHACGHYVDRYSVSSS
jgi:hypothetical protein